MYCHFSHPDEFSPAIGPMSTTEGTVWVCEGHAFFIGRYHKRNAIGQWRVTYGTSCTRATDSRSQFLKSQKLSDAYEAANTEMLKLTDMIGSIA